MFSRTKQGHIDVIAGSMPLSGESLDDVLKLFEECIDESQPHIVFDMQRIPLIDSDGLELLMDLHDRCQERGGSITLAAPSPLCRDILNLSGVGARFETASDVIEAAGRFAL